LVSPNTQRRGQRRAKTKYAPGLKQVFDLIDGAKQAILFVAFEPGEPSIIDRIGAAQKANPALFVRGYGDGLQGGARFRRRDQERCEGCGSERTSDSGQKVPADFRVIPATAIRDPFGVWETELNSAGFAITHSKFVVIDPFSDGCVVGPAATSRFSSLYNNDENLAIIKGHRPIAEAYAANALDIYDHYAWRLVAVAESATAWTSLKADDSWQKRYFDADSRPIP